MPNIPMQWWLLTQATTEVHPKNSLNDERVISDFSVNTPPYDAFYFILH
jgi:hypothetical protein